MEYLLVNKTKFSPELNLPAVWMKKQTQAQQAMMFSKSWNINKTEVYHEPHQQVSQ